VYREAALYLSTVARKTASAVGLRQMFPKHKNRTEDLEAPDLEEAMTRGEGMGTIPNGMMRGKTVTIVSF
jgi:hypothetical protein